jgi:hypothetical protein
VCSCNNCCSRRAINVTYSDCVFVALVIQHAMRMRHIVICSLSGSIIFSPHYLTKGTIFKRKCYCIKIYVLIFSATFVWKNERDMIKMYIGLHVNYPLFLSDFNETWIFLDRFSRNPKISNFMKIRPDGAEVFQADGRTQTDVTKLILFTILRTRLKTSKLLNK